MAHGRLVWVLAVLLGHLSPSLGLASPRMSFPLGSKERPLQHFSQSDVSDTTALLLSGDGSTLFVGARDAVLSLDVSQPGVMTMKSNMAWKPPPGHVNDCVKKGKDERRCLNFVRVLQPINATHLYACGSHAYGPRDTYIDADSLTMVKVPNKHDDEARKRCPYDPFQRSTALTIDGELFTGTTSDYKAKEPVISRHLSRDGRPDVSTSVHLLDEPSFVSSSSDPTDGKLYFFFSEVGKEYSFLEPLNVSRVAQVCKDDVGGERVLQKRWTSFAKAHLLCQPPNQLPFNLIQDMFTLRPQEGAATKETLFYGVFTSQWSLAAKSAVCVFGMKAIKEVFTGNYRTYDKENQQWNRLTERHPDLGRCGLSNASDTLTVAKDTFLASAAVRPLRDVLVSPDQLYARVAAMTARAASGEDYTVLFLLSESGWLHKAVVLDQGSHIIEEIQVFREPQLMKSMLLSTSKGVVFVGTSEGVTQVPVARCPSYQSCAQCVMARDPLCGWDRAGRVCVRVPVTPMDLVQDVEHGNASECRDSAKPATVPIYTQLYKEVRLPCSKPSNLATLIWKSSKASTLHQRFPFQYEEGSLVFLATPATLDTYRCVSMERGDEETVVSYTVSQSVSPRSFGSSRVQSRTTIKSNNIEMKTPAKVQETSVTPKLTSVTPKLTSVTPKLTSVTPKLTSVTPKLTTPSMDTKKIPLEELETPGAQSENTYEPETSRSYLSELVAVSLLLALCVGVIILGGLYRWRHHGRYGPGDHTPEGEDLALQQVNGEKETKDPSQYPPKPSNPEPSQTY